MDVSHWLIATYCVVLGGLAWFAVLNWRDARRRGAPAATWFWARMVIFAPVWPFVLLSLVGVGIGQLALDASIQRKGGSDA